MILLVLNCGSSSVKFQVCRMPEYTVLVKGSIGKIGYADAEFKAISARTGGIPSFTICVFLVRNQPVKRL